MPAPGLVSTGGIGIRRTQVRAHQHHQAPQDPWQRTDVPNQEADREASSAHTGSRDTSCHVLLSETPHPPSGRAQRGLFITTLDVGEGPPSTSGASASLHPFQDTRDAPPPPLSLRPWASRPIAHWRHAILVLRLRGFGNRIVNSDLATT